MLNINLHLCYKFTMLQRNFLRMVASFLDVSEKIAHTTPNQFETMIHTSSMDPMLRQLFDLEEEIHTVRVAYENCLQKNKEQIETPKIEEKRTKRQPKVEKEQVESVNEVVKEIKTNESPDKETKEVKEKETKKKNDKKKEKDKPVTENTVEVVVSQQVPIVTAPIPATEVMPAPVPGEDVEDDVKLPIHVRRKTIPKYIKSLVWNKYMGENNTTSKCVCCLSQTIDCRSFHCGHVISEAKGGDLSITNLRPICASCNLAMSTKSMNEFCIEFFKREIPQ